MSKLKVEHLTRYFGGLAALLEVTLAVETGERRAIIGPNGAGKSTLFDLVAGELWPTRGKVYLDGRDITGRPVYERANLGLGRTFQRNKLFLGLSVFENVYLAVQHHHGAASQLFKPALQLKTISQETEKLLERVGIIAQRNQLVGALAYGQQRVLEVALALAGEPKVLLLDEPTAGMSPAETVEMTRLIESLPRQLTILIVEHDMDVVFSLANAITVLHDGRVISQGRPDEVRADPVVQEIYLGVNHG